MSQIEEIISKTRSLIEDFKTSRKNPEVYIYKNLKVFTLWEENVDSSTIKVYKNGTLLSSENWTFDNDVNKLSITSSLITGDKIEFYYSYSRYSDTEIIEYIRGALVKISENGYNIDTPFILETVDEIAPIPTAREENLISAVTAILILPNFSRYTSPEFTFYFPETMSKEEKIALTVHKYIDQTGAFEALDLEE